MRSPAYYKAKLLWIGSCILWTLFGAAVIAGLVDFIAEWNRSGELEWIIGLGLLCGLCCAIKALRYVYADR